VSILDKHPAPWAIKAKSEETGETGYCEGKFVFDGNGVYVAGGEVVEFDSGGEVEAGVEFTDDGVKRLILAAPELLAALRGCYAVLRRHTMTHAGRSDVEARKEWERAEALIARIDGGNGRSTVALAEIGK
jgi:hypothetical protein